MRWMKTGLAWVWGLAAVFSASVLLASVQEDFYDVPVGDQSITLRLTKLSQTRGVNQPKTVVVMLPGMSGSYGKLKHFLQAVCEGEAPDLGNCPDEKCDHAKIEVQPLQGYRDVWCVDHRGHGASGGRPQGTMATHIDSFDTYLKDLDLLFEYMNNHYRTQNPAALNWVLVGHSMGAHLALRWFKSSEDLQEMRHEPALNFSKFIGIAPMIRFDTEWVPYYLLRGVAMLMTYVGYGEYYIPTHGDFEHMQAHKRPFHRSEHARNRVNGHFVKSEHLGHRNGGTTWGWIDAAFESQEKLLENPPLQTSIPPITFFVAGLDETVKNDAIVELGAKLPMDVKFYPRAFHELATYEPLCCVGNFWPDFLSFLQ